MLTNILLAVENTNIWKVIFVDNLGYIGEGLLNTLLIVICAFPIGIIIGTLIGVSYYVPNSNIFIKIWKGFNKVYVSIFRGTPIVVQLLFIYMVLLMPLHVPKLLVAILIFGMNSGAYVSEIVRSGIASIDKGQMEAGRSLGLPYGRTMLKIVMPQAVKNIMPTLGNELISLTKETSVAGYVAVVDITTALNWIGSTQFEVFVPYFVLGLIYFVLVYIITQLLKLLERRLSRSDKR